MARWSEKLGNSINFAIETVPEVTFLESFYRKESFVPDTKEEIREFDDFSFVSCAMALSVYIALADESISGPEKHQILSEMLFQIEHFHYEYEVHSERFGNADKEIINSLYEKYKEEILTGVFELNELIGLVNKLYHDNPKKKKYLLRLCYMVAYTESVDINKQLDQVDQIAVMLKVEEADRDTIKEEVQAEIEKYR